MVDKLGRDFWFYRLGSFVDGVLLNALLIGFSVWVLKTFDNAALLAAVIVPATISQVAFNMIFAPFADRYSRKTLMLVASIGNLVLCSFFYFFLGKFGASVLMLSLFYALYSVINCIYTSAEAAILPQLVEKDKLAFAQSSIQAVKAFEGIVGAVLGAYLASIFSLDYLIIFLILGKFINSACIYLLRNNYEAVSTQITSILDYKLWFKDVSEGLSFIAKSSVLKSISLFVCMLNLFFAPVLLVSEIVIIKELFLDPVFIGYASAGLLIGVIIGSFITTKTFSENKQPLWTMFSCALVAISLIFLFFTDTFLMILVAFLFVGICQNMINIPMMTNLAASVPNQIRARVTTSIYTLCHISGPLGIVIFTNVAERYNGYHSFLFMGIGLLAIAPLPFLLKPARVFLSMKLNSIEKWFKRAKAV